LLAYNALIGIQCVKLRVLCNVELNFIVFVRIVHGVEARNRHPFC